MTSKSLFGTLLYKEQNKLQKLALFETYKVNNTNLVAQGVLAEDTPQPLLLTYN